jgi:hypothetical protein
MSDLDTTIHVVHQLLSNLQLEVSAIRAENADTREKITQIELSLAKGFGYGAGVVSVIAVFFTLITAAVSYLKSS